MKLLYKVNSEEKIELIDKAMDEFKESFMSSSDNKKENTLKKLTELENIRSNINNKLPKDLSFKGIINGDNIFNVQIDGKTGKFYFDMDNSYLN